MGNESNDGLEYLRNFLGGTNVWSFPDVKVDPIKYLAAWAVFRATPHDAKNEEHFGLHFMGLNLADYSGAVSSRIVSFDPHVMRGVTSSGRLYQLVGLPGYCDDAHYVRDAWSAGNRVDIEDATDAFLDQYGLTIEGLEKAISAQGNAGSLTSAASMPTQEAKAPKTASKPRKTRKAAKTGRKIIEKLALEVFKDRDKARAWLSSYNLALRTIPASMLDTEAGREEVRRVLCAIATGGVV